MLGPHLRIDHRPATASLINECAAVAARSFYTDPFFRHLGPPALLRYRGLAIFFRANLRHLGRNGRISTVRTTDDHIVGVAGWITTDGYPQSLYHQLASAPGTLRALYRRPRALIAGAPDADCATRSWAVCRRRRAQALAHAASGRRAPRGFRPHAPAPHAARPLHR